MFDFFIGDILHIDSDYIVLSNNNIGFHININTEKVKLLEIRKDIKIFVELVVREDSMSLYGFLTRDERTLYNMLTQVSGVGPKVGMGMLNALTPSEIRHSILLEDAKMLATAPGIGKKTSERIVLELKDKISKYEFEKDLYFEPNEVILQSDKSDMTSALEALTTLGYNKQEAGEVLNKISEDLSLEEIIKEALKLMAK